MNDKKETEIVNTNDITSAKTYIVAGRGSYAYRRELEMEGFSFKKDMRVWEKVGSIKNMVAYEKKYPDIAFRLE